MCVHSHSVSVSSVREAEADVIPKRSRINACVCFGGRGGGGGGGQEMIYSSPSSSQTQPCRTDRRLRLVSPVSLIQGLVFLFMSFFMLVICYLHIFLLLLKNGLTVTFIIIFYN